MFATGENFDETDLTTRQPRAAVGQLADGHVILVAVEGGRPGYSVGMTTYELAKTMASLGAVTAAGLQYGRFVEAAFDGQPLTRPSQGSNQVPVKEALLVQYAGVYAPAPVPALLGKDNAAAGVQLAYRLTRPSTVTATVVGPDGVSHPLDSGARQPGAYHFTFTGLTAEGTWHWTVQATDDQNRTSTADQTFVFDETLTGLAVPRSATAEPASTPRSRFPARPRSSSRSRPRTARRSRPSRRCSSPPAPSRSPGTGRSPAVRRPPPAPTSRSSPTRARSGRRPTARRSRSTVERRPRRPLASTP